MCLCMMIIMERPELPNPNVANVRAWLAYLTRRRLHEEGWQTANRGFHGITSAAREYANTHYPDPAAREAFLDGLTLGLVAVERFHAIERFEATLQLPAAPFEVAPTAETTLADDAAA